MSTRILLGDARVTLATLAAESVQTCVTSPPYFSQRDYNGGAAEIGREATISEYVVNLVDVFGLVRRVLRHDATLWVNLGDVFQNKQLLGVPWRVAFALQADGWILRQAITWCKPAPFPESVRDRCTSATEMVFMLTKSPSYTYFADAIAEPALGTGGGEVPGPDKAARAGITTNGTGATSLRGKGAATRNRRNWWVIPPNGFPGSHFATMPVALAELCIRAGSRSGDTVLDPFSGAGTTALVADRLGRHGIGCELNPSYAALSTVRVTDDAPLFARVAAE